MRFVRWFGILILVVAFMGLIAVPLPAQAQEVSGSVDPTVGRPGTTFFFVAEGFRTDEEVGVWINAPDGSILRIVKANGDELVLIAGQRGRIEWAVTMSEDAQPGFYGMVARGTRTGRELVIPFQLDPGAPPPAPPEPEGSWGVDPTSGPPGTTFFFFAEGFDNSEQVGVWINAPDGSIFRIVRPNGQELVFEADDDGRAEWSVTMSESAPSGFYTMVIRGVDSGLERVIPFQVE